MCALGVAADNELRIGTSLVVVGYLGNASFATRLHGAAVFNCQGIIERNVLVVAALEPRANSLHELSLTARIRLIVPSRQKDLDISARVQARLLCGYNS